MVKFNCFSGRPNKMKKKFETFLISHYTGDVLMFEIKIFLVRNKKYLYQIHPLYTIRVSPHKMLHMSFLGSCNIYYLSTCKRSFFKSYYC